MFANPFSVEKSAVLKLRPIDVKTGTLDLADFATTRILIRLFFVSLRYQSLS
jgi:hypothetical protein